MQEDRFSNLGSSGDRPESHAEAGWQPIETAPKNGTRVLAYEKGAYYTAWYGYFPRDNVCGWQDDADSEPAPTHWMPLPKPPMGRDQPSSDSPASGGTGQSEKDGCSVSTLQARITELEEALDDLLDLVQWSVSSDSPAMVRALAALKEPNHE